MFSLFGNSIESEYETLKQKCFEQDTELSLKTQEIQELKKERQSLLDQLHINQLAFQKEISQLKDQSLQKDLESLEQKEVDRQSLLDQLRAEQVEKEKREKEASMKKEIYSYFENDTSSYGPKQFEKRIMYIQQNHTPYVLKMVKIYEYISREVILFYHGDVSTTYNIPQIDTSRYSSISVVFTKKNIYRIVSKYVNREWNIFLCPLYTFSNELDVKSLIILKNIKESGSATSFYIADTSINILDPFRVSTEKAIRMIPGSYQFGPWKELNGFFGSYFNEETFEISTSPPHLDI